ncbi:MAG: iron-containing alcohol dehydrogenase [Planctomycetes bacterium]|nr:iron-containing alcohol dehydrogenase [Planctomycetota bacterium]
MNDALADLLAHSPIDVVADAGALSRLGELAESLGGKRVLLVTDPGIEEAGHAVAAVRSLEGRGIHVVLFDGVQENPTTQHVAEGVELASRDDIDLVVGLGGGSAMDCAKAINLLLTNSGEVKDYWGEGKASQKLLPMIAVPTTAGTGSEAQSFALISDPVTHQKMACGDRRHPREGGLRPRIAILDHELTRSQPAQVAAASAIDAVSHAVETAATIKQTQVSLKFSREAWRFLDRAFERALADPDVSHARRDMLWGAHLAGVAIEQSMLGAAHACANPLTAKYGLIHGFAVGMMLPHVVRFNVACKPQAYDALGVDRDALLSRLAELLVAAEVPISLSSVGVVEDGIPELAESAASQWTGTFNPVPVDRHAFEQIYAAAFCGT